MDIGARKYHQGFTLIELMLAMTLGLLVTGAVLQILLSSQSSVSAQQAGSDIQADGIFGLDTLKKSIRSLNYGAFPNASGDEFVMTNTTPAGGLVLSVADSAAARPTSNILPIVTSNTDKLLSASDEHETNLKATSGTLKSDQLVLQRKLEADGFDCEGTHVSAGFYLVERYYLTTDTTTFRPNEPTALALACKAVSYGVEPTSGAAPVAVTNNPEQLNETFQFVGGVAAINNPGTILMNRVDHFHYLIGVESGRDVIRTPANSSVRYLSVADYMDAAITPAPKPRIVSIRIGLVVRSSNAINTGIANSDQEFDVLDQKGLVLKPAIAAKSQYQRQAYETTVLIRNARGDMS